MEQGQFGIIFLSLALDRLTVNVLCMCECDVGSSDVWMVYDDDDKKRKMYQPAAPLSPAGERDPPVHERGNGVSPPPRPPASVE